MGNTNLNRRQFVIGPRPIFNSELKWKHIKIDNYLYLSYCPTLPIISDYDERGNKVIIMGIALQTESSKREPIEIARRTLDEISNYYDTWAGRWNLIKNNELHMDFSGLLGCFYTTYNGEFWVSNSLSILSELITDSNIYTDELAEGPMNWYPSPNSKNPAIKSLLPSQVLLLQTKEIRTRQLFPKKKLKYSETEALDVIQNSLINALQKLSENGETIWIPLSAGYDSRLLLAAALKAGVNIKTYTMKKSLTTSLGIPNTSLPSYADMTLPSKIAKLAEVEHKWIDIKEFSNEKLDLIDKHTYKSTLENDRIYFARGQWDWTTDQDIILLGQVLEVGSCQYYDLLKKSPDNETVEIIEKFNLRIDSAKYEGILAYSKWVDYYNYVYSEQIDWRDRFYLEQRLSGWLRAGQQGLDLVKGERIHVYNTQRILCAALSLPHHKRKNKEFIKDLIKRMAPELNELPYNPPDPIIFKLRKNFMALSQKSNVEILQALRRRFR